jgi:hypothetical protein
LPSLDMVRERGFWLFDPGTGLLKASRSVAIYFVKSSLIFGKIRYA